MITVGELIKYLETKEPDDVIKVIIGEYGGGYPIYSNLNITEFNNLEVRG